MTQLAGVFYGGEKCGCRVIGKGIPLDPLRVERCPEHSFTLDSLLTDEGEEKLCFWVVGIADRTAEEELDLEKTLDAVGEIHTHLTSLLNELEEQREAKKEGVL